MKKLLLFIGIIISTTAVVRGQKLQYNFQAGLGFATQGIVNPDILSVNSVTTYNIGVSVDIPIKRFFIEPGIGIVGKGVKEYQNAETQTITLTYLDVPLTAIYKFDLPTLGKLYLGAGPYVSMGLSGNNQDEVVNSTTGSAIVFGRTDDYKLIDYGLNFTAGLALNSHLTFHIKYSYELNNIASDAPDDVNTTSVKNKVFSIGLGFWL
jgi:hypothetical protein